MANSSLPNLAQDLLRIHRAITRGLTVGVSRGDEFAQEGFQDSELRRGFMLYVQSLGVILEAHHLAEDEIAFPYFKEKLPAVPYERLSVDHREIQTMVDAIREAMKDVKASGAGDGLTRMVDGLRQISGVWTPHIQIEEERFSAKALSGVMSIDEQGRISGAMAKHSQEHATPGYLALPFVLFNLSGEDRDEMAAAMPPVVVEELVPKVWKGQWAPMKPFLLE
jgi:hemerythrin-like domain-containing protein